MDGEDSLCIIGRLQKASFLFPSTPHFCHDKLAYKKDDEQDRCSETTHSMVIELGQFDIKYWPRVAIKAQVLANFIAEFTYPCKEEEPPMEIWTVQIDGSATKKVEGVGVVLIPPKGEKLKYAVRLQLPATNNEAEYEALLTGLSPVKALGAKSLIV